MPVLNTAVRVATKAVPRVISPEAHKASENLLAGVFFAGAFLFWRRNKRAGLASLICGSVQLAVSLLTHTPNGTRRAFSLSTHRDIELGLAAMVATMPSFLAFKDAPEARFFLMQGAAITGLNQLTQFPEAEEDPFIKAKAA
jgi:hypothetical protein